jgi:hypothetical protein
MFADVFAVIGNISAVIGIITGIAAGYAAVRLWLLSVTYRRRLKALTQRRTRRPVAFAIGIEGDITGTVRSHLKDEGLDDIELISISRPARLTPAELLHVREEFLQHKNRLTAEVGPTEVHFFYKGPGTLATALGALLNNWAPTIVYSFENGAYTAVLQLDKNSAIDKSVLKGSPKK